MSYTLEISNEIIKYDGLKANAKILLLAGIIVLIGSMAIYATASSVYVF